MQLLTRKFLTQQVKNYFCQSNKNLKPKQENQTITEKKTYRYANEKFDLINNPSFIEKIQKMELMNRPRMKALENYRFPLLLIGTSLFLYHLWQVMPYSLIYRHTTVSEYIPREKFYHVPILASLSFQTTGHFLTYFPLLVGSLILCGIYMKTRHMIILYLSNAILSTALTFLYERKKNEKFGINMISPKCIGAVTPLAFISAFFAINPNYLILNLRPLPIFIVPEFQAGYVNEVCRPAHLAASAYGLLFGFVFKKIVLKGII